MSLSVEVVSLSVGAEADEAAEAGAAAAPKYISVRLEMW